MKKLIALLALAGLALLALAGCRTEPEAGGTDSPAIEPTVPEASAPAASQPNGSGGDPETFPGEQTVTCRVKVLPNNRNRLLVTDWGEPEYAVGLCDVYVKDAQILGVDGEAVTLEELRPGIILNITWNGMVMESYPGQVIANEVRVVEQGDDLVGMYRQALNELWTESGQKGGVEKLGLDFSGLTGLTTQEQSALAYLTACDLDMADSYNNLGTWDELANSGFIVPDEEGWWPDGMLLSLSEYDREDGHVGFIASSSRTKDGAALVLTCVGDRQEDGIWGYQSFSPSGT